MDPEFARQYYESASVDHWWFQGRKHLVRRLLEDRGVTTGRFVDLGAGSESLFPDGVSVVKVDVVRPEPVSGLFVQASADDLPFRRASFDGVGAFDLLEHLSEPAGCLNEVRRVVRPGGWLVVTVPAFQWLWSPHDDLVGHHRRYTPELLEAELSSAGLTVDWMSAFYRFLLAPALVRSVLSLESAMKLPPTMVNRFLSRLATRSVSGVLRRPSHWGLSLVAVASVP